MKKFIFLTMILCNFFNETFASSLDVPFDYSMYNDQKKYDCRFKRCYTLEEIVEKLKRDNYDIRDKLQGLIQVRHNIKVKRARLIPSFNLSLGVSAGLMDFIAVPSLLGFLFPSNWFNWKESKLFYLAQRESYKTLLANQISTGIELYFILHQEFVDTEIYSHYYSLIKNIESFFEEEIKKGNKKITSYHLRRLRSFKSSAKIKAILLENEFKDTFPLLANLMAMPIDERWDQSSIILKKLPTLSKFKKEDPNAFYHEVINLSPEVKAIEYLLLATKYTKKSRIFSFLTPSASNDESLGAGYISQIKIVKSRKKQLEIKKEKTASLLKVSIHSLILNHNAAIDTYKEASIGRKNTKKLLKGIFKRYKNTNKIDIEQVIEVLSSALEFDLARSFSQHYFFANKSNMDRYLFEGNFFSSLDVMIPSQGKLDSISSLRRAREDKRIKRDIAKKKIKI